MNETPEADPAATCPLPVPYKDRSTGLIVFGILTIGLGCLAGLFVLLLLVQSAGIAHQEAAPVQTLLPAMAVYGGLAAALVWLGIGSIMARRWARALLLIFSWSWLIVGLITLLCMAFFVPTIMAGMHSAGVNGQPALPAAAMGAVMFGMFLMFGVFFVVLPAIWVVFYNSRHVKATCATRDPVVRWTDACPLPVLAVCLWTIVSAPTMLLMPMAGHSVMPFFGVFLTGFSAAMFCLAIVAVWCYAAWLLYKLEQRGWWLLLAGWCLVMISSILTFARHDVLEMYRLMQYPDTVIQQMQKSGFLAGNQMVWMMLLFMAPFLGYLLFIKKFLRQRDPGPKPAGQPLV
jgi:uncharacterized membrane protein